MSSKGGEHGWKTVTNKKAVKGRDEVGNLRRRVKHTDVNINVNIYIYNCSAVDLPLRFQLQALEKKKSSKNNNRRKKGGAAGDDDPATASSVTGVDPLRNGSGASAGGAGLGFQTHSTAFDKLDAQLERERKRAEEDQDISDEERQVWTRTHMYNIWREREREM